MHSNNILYRPAQGDFKIVDFGFAVVLPPPLREKVIGALWNGVNEGWRSLGEIWLSKDTGLLAYTNRVQATRTRDLGFTTKNFWYNPDHMILVNMYNRLSATDREQIPELRRRVWGGGMNAAAPPRNNRAPVSTPARPLTRANSGGRRGGCWSRTGRGKAATRNCCRNWDPTAKYKTSDSPLFWIGYATPNGEYHTVIQPTRWLWR